MTWYYKKQPFQPQTNQLESWVGFVYIIQDNDTGMKYIGKKLFHHKKILPKTKTRKRRKHVLVESDWRDYFGSNQLLNEHVAQKGKDKYTRTILHLCQSKGMCSYLEAKEQFDRDVLLRDDYYNGIINCRISKKHVSPTIS